MAKTLADVDVQKTPASQTKTIPAHQRAEQPRRENRRALWLVPLALAAAGGVTYLIARRLSMPAQKRGRRG